MPLPFDTPEAANHAEFSFTVDVEDYFHVSALESVCPRSSWSGFESRVVENTIQLLELMAEHQVRATFFVLGWVADRHPQLIRRVLEQGHEIACHGYHHQRLNTITSTMFQRDIDHSKKLLEDISGQPIWGYRAPSFSVTEDRPWIQTVLREAGFRYSSSVNPVPHDLYGCANARRTPFFWGNGLLEIPVATCQFARHRIPCAGGGYFRLYPYLLSRKLLSTAARQLGGPVVFYLHPWEIDPDQPRFDNTPLKSRFRHYLNLHRTLPRLERLLDAFNWGPMRELAVVRQLMA